MTVTHLTSSSKSFLPHHRNLPPSNRNIIHKPAEIIFESVLLPKVLSPPKMSLSSLSPNEISSKHEQHTRPKALTFMIPQETQDTSNGATSNSSIHPRPNGGSSSFFEGEQASDSSFHPLCTPSDCTGSQNKQPHYEQCQQGKFDIMPKIFILDMW